MKILYRHRGRARSTWIVRDNNNIIEIKAVLRSIDMRGYSYSVYVNGAPKFTVTVPGPEKLEEEALKVKQKW
jgi:translation initiation factor 2 alpha subunit (eIF-2alpha)